MKYPVITLTTDFGASDHYVGAMKGVILGICPDARLVDISHEIQAYAVADASFTISQAWTCFPQGAVHLVVVDPGVGSERRPIVAEVGGHYFVAPDNGVLSMVFDQSEQSVVREITTSGYFRQPLSQTFHGRDIFAPVAAHLAKGVALAEFGAVVHDPARGAFTRPILESSGVWTGAILKADRFGNLVTTFATAAWRQLSSEPFELRVGGRLVTKVLSNYAAAAVGEIFLIEGSAGFWEISARQASAAATTGVGSGEKVELRLGRDK